MLALLLNWRVWAAVVLVASLAMCGLGGYRYGKADVQQQFDAYKTVQVQEALKQQQLADAKEQSMQTSNSKVRHTYVLKASGTSSGIRDLASLRLRERSSS